MKTNKIFLATTISVFLFLGIFVVSSAATIGAGGSAGFQSSGSGGIGGVNFNINGSGSSMGCNLGRVPANFKDLVFNFLIGCFVSPLIYITVFLAVLVFIWGVFKFMRAEGDAKQAGRDFILWGIIGLFIMISLWGLVAVLTRTFNTDASYSITPRQISVPGY